MSEEKKNYTSPSLKELLEKYQGSSVVSEIEKNIRLTSSFTLLSEKIVLYPLFDETNYDLKASPLKDSLMENGIMFPLFVVPTGDNYAVINGVKRFLIAKSLGFQEIPVVVLDLAEPFIVAYILQNEIKNGDNALVKGTAYKNLMTKFAYSEKDIRLLTGLSHGQVNNLMRVLSLPKEVKAEMVAGRLQYAQARVLLGLAKSEQLELMHRFIDEDLSVREAEKLAGSFKKSSFYHQDRVKFSRTGQTITVHLDSPAEADRLERLIRDFINK